MCERESACSRVVLSIRTSEYDDTITSCSISLCVIGVFGASAARRYEANEREREKQEEEKTSSGKGGAPPLEDYTVQAVSNSHVQKCLYSKRKTKAKEGGEGEKRCRAYSGNKDTKC